jgi:hypothetical protein
MKNNIGIKSIEQRRKPVLSQNMNFISQFFQQDNLLLLKGLYTTSLFMLEQCKSFSF